MKPAAILISFFLAVFLTGCSDMNMSHNEELIKFNILPSDGASNVRLDENIKLTFDKPMDRLIVERNFHVYSEKGMSDSLCPLGASMNHTEMMLAMQSSAMMQHLSEFHHLEGSFSWNSESTVCIFTPGQMLMPDMLHMMHIQSGMMNMMTERMGNLGMMNGHGSGSMMNEMMMHFITTDTESNNN